MLLEQKQMTGVAGRYDLESISGEIPIDSDFQIVTRLVISACRNIGMNKSTNIKA